MFVCLLARLEDAVDVVDAAEPPLEVEEHGLGGSRAVDASLISKSCCRIESAHKGERKLSSPARWSL